MQDITKYVHRVGRTARAGQNGCAVTFATEKDRPLLKAVVKRAGRSLRSRQVATAAVAKCRDQIEGLESDIREVMQEEAEEKALRKAEMEVNKVGCWSVFLVGCCCMSRWRVSF
jgi:ATP-dependent RNA helicase DDX27